MTVPFSLLPAATPASLADTDLVPISQFVMTAPSTRKLTLAQLRTQVGFPLINAKAAPYNCAGDGVTDDTAGLTAARAAALAVGGVLFLPTGTYLTSQPLLYTTAPRIQGMPGTRIKLTAASAVSVLSIDGSASANIYGADVRDLILDGGGFCPDGLLLKNVISSYFLNIRATNVTVAGFHFAWAQLVTMVNPICSSNVEAFTTTPANGLLADATTTSTANTIINPMFEHVSGSGIKGLSIGNTQFIGGTSEGNNIGIEFGETVDVGKVALGNSVYGMDLESNTTSDVILRLTAGENDFVGLRAGTASPAIQLIGAKRNKFLGGSSAGFTLDAVSQNNDLDTVTLYGAGATVSDAGLNNTRRNIYNLSTGAQLTDAPMRRRGYHLPANAATVTINCAFTAYEVVGVGFATFTVGAPTNPVDGYDLDIRIHNTSGGAITTTWNAVFKIAGWTDPATAKNRTARFRYDSNYGAWYVVSIGQVDVPN